MPPSRTPIFDSRERQKHYTTPVKAKVQGAVEFCERMGISYYKEDVFRTFDVSREQGYAFLRNDSARRLENNSDAEETRGRKSLITPKQIREMERILETECIEGRGCKNHYPGKTNSSQLPKRLSMKKRNLSTKKNVKSICPFALLLEVSIRL